MTHETEQNINELDVIIIEVEDASHGEQHHQTHPLVVRIYSEVDESNHPFRVKPATTVGHVFEAFYRSTGLTPGEFDSFKCEANGRQLEELRGESLAKLQESGQCSPLVWIFSNRLTIVVQVNNRPVAFHTKEATGLEIKKTAIAEGVAIQADFCLFLVKDGRQEPIKDDQNVRLHRGEDFDAVDPDHCS